MENTEDLQKVRHSAAHILAAAVLRLFPDAKTDIGPAISTGFYYDFDLEHKFTAEDLKTIEAEMKNIVDENQKIERIEMSRDEAYKIFSEKNQTYKLERLQDIPSDETVIIYKNGEYTDLCRGPHVSYTKQVKAVKLLSIAGAYYRGDEKNKQLQRIYGTAFSSKEELNDWLLIQEEAKQRDHRKLGRELKLFMIDEEVGNGMVMWLPKGMILRNALQNFILEALEEQGYQQVFTPHIAKLGLFKISGHFPYYKDSQFAPIPDRVTLEEGIAKGLDCKTFFENLENGNSEGFMLKPMNCPGHIRIYQSEPHSYRDLPVKLAEFGTVYRWEQSGELSGMTRVRSFTQDDAHIFCTPEQLDDEINACLQLVRMIFNTLNMQDFRVRISLRDKSSDKYIGDDENWKVSEEALRKAVKSLDVPYEEKEGEAAFYGPKIDFIIKDVIGREWQLGTVQIDYNLPERFKLTYVGSDNKEHTPIMIHRAPFGSLERFVGVLIEHFGGDFPTWLAPEQVRILTITDDANEFAKNLKKQLKKQGVRAEVDAESDKLGAKIRRTELDKVPNVFVIGKNEIANNEVSVRSRLNKNFTGTMSIEQATQQLLSDIKNRTLYTK